MMRFHVDDTHSPQNIHSPALVSVAIQLSRPIRLTDFLRTADSPIRVHWQHQHQPVAYAGYGAAAVIQSHSSDRFDDIRAQANALFSRLDVHPMPAYAEPRLFGGFSFQNETQTGPWQDFSPAWFVLPRVMLTSTGDAHWLTLTSDLSDTQTRNDLRSEAIAIAACLNAYHQSVDTISSHLLSIDYPLSLHMWRSQIHDALGRIAQGTLEKVVLSRISDLCFDRPVDPLFALDRLSQRYPDTYRFLIAPSPSSAFLGATPEVLTEVHGQHLRTAAVAGSTRRGKTPDEDAALAAGLFTNPKERHEHALVAQNLRDLLEPLTSHLHAPEDPHILTLSNIQHLYTPFEGTLSDHTDVLHVAHTLHPTPALGGCPQQLAMDTIREIEPISRGWYASPVGWFDRHGSGIFAVAIRSAVLHGPTARLYAGCGIVAQSNPDREWEETSIKFRPMLDALGAPSL